MPVIEFHAYRPEVIASGHNRSAALKVIVDRLMALRQFSTPTSPITAAAIALFTRAYSSISTMIVDRRTCR